MSSARPLLCASNSSILPALLYSSSTYTCILGSLSVLPEPWRSPWSWSLWALGRELAIGFPSLTCCSCQAVTTSYQPALLFLLNTAGAPDLSRDSQGQPSSVQLHCELSASSAHRRSSCCYSSSGGRGVTETESGDMADHV